MILKYLILTFFLFSLNTEILTQYNVLESNDAKDLIFESTFSNNQLTYFNLIDIPSIQDSLTETESGVLGYYNLENKKASRTVIYSKYDSINSILFIAEDNNNSMYTLRTNKNNITDINPVYFLEKRTKNLATVLESNLIDINENLDRVVNAFFDKNNILQIKSFQFSPSYSTHYYSIDQNSIITNVNQSNIEDVHIQEINDSTYISLSYTLNKLIYLKKDFTTIIKQVDLDSSIYHFFITEKTVITDSTLYFSGIRLTTTKEEYVIYKHELYTDSCTLIFIDTNIYTPQPRRAFRALSIKDTNFIFGGTNYYDCMQLFDNTCLSSFQIYCVNSQGQLNWSKNIGENDGYNFLMELHATPDTGCLALFYRYTDEASYKNGDFYWLKLDKYGNNDNTYLNGFNFSIENPSLIFSEITVYPNPTKDLVTFYFPSTLENPLIQIFDIQAKLVFSTKFINKELDISRINKGTYVYQLKDNNKLITYGKLIKL